MTVIDQPKTVYSDASTQARAISDVISLIDPRPYPIYRLPLKFRIEVI